jgi:hypothetical protein
MNPKLQLAQETMKRLRSRRCVQRVVLLRLTIADAQLLKETLACTIRECDDTDANRPTILLCDKLNKSLRDKIAKQQNDPSSATRRTGRVDCNRDALAGFAAAHG